MGWDVELSEDVEEELVHVLTSRSTYLSFPGLSEARGSESVW